MDLLASQRGEALERLPDIFGFKIWVFFENFLGSHPVGDEIHHERHSDPHPSDTGAPPP